MSPYQKQFVAVFLQSACDLIDESFELIPSQKNVSTLSELGFSKKVVKEEIRRLVPEDFSEIPKQLDGSSGTAWVFGKMVEGKEIYIKLEICGYSNRGDKRKTLYCHSFHVSENKMVYPFK